MTLSNNQERMKSLQNSRARYNNSGHGEFPSLFERLLVAVNYFSFGLVGFIYLVINAIRGGRLTPFMQYHIFQSFFLVMFYWLLTVFISLIAQILSFVPFINILVLKILFYFNTPFILGRYSLVSGTVSLIILYLAFTSFQGLYSYVPWVSDVIKRSIRR